MESEKHKLDEEAPPATTTHVVTATTGARRSIMRQRRIMVGIFGAFTLWSVFNFMDALRDLRNGPELPSLTWTGESSPAQSYMDRLVGGGQSVYSSSHEGGHHGHDGKHGHKDKHGHHEKHGKHGHGKHDKHHGKHGPGHGHGPEHPPRWMSPKEAEDIFLSVPNNDSIRADARKYTATPHPAGSGFDYITALQVKSQWERSLGLPTSGSDENIYEAGSSESQSRVYDGMGKLGVWIDTYYPVMNTPVTASVTILSDPPIKAKLREDIVQGDPDSVYRDDVPVFHGLSVSGDVTGQVVYAGYGRKRDFEALQAKGIDLTGKIALVKYGGNFRGLKIKAAQEAGAVGCLIFTDPGDDGEMTEEHGYAQYPEGPARQQSSVQRGSVQFISVYPGDPSTPGEPAYKNATRAEGTNQPSIPSLPISYEDAIPILNALKGHGTPAGEISEDWIGGLGFYGVDYFTGPSEVELHFVNEVNTRVMPIWNTMAVIPGHITDEVVVIGNHRDAWVLGAGDPNSGTAAHNEMVRGFGKLLSKGWKPLRTIVLASWDAEEYGLIGSTEWTEDFGDWLKANNAIYLNVDVAVAGPNFKCAASPSLAWLIRKAAEQVQSQPDGSSVWDARADDDDWKTWRVQGDELEVSLEERSETGVKALGSGSDYTSFLQRYGVASGDIGYTYGSNSPVYHYHSIYDSFTWQEKYGDPGFHRHVDAAKILGLLSLRAADSLVLPLNTTQYAIELGYYLEKVQHIANSTQLDLEGSLDLSTLGHAIHGLINASYALDHQTSADLEKLHKLLPPPPPHPPHHDHPHHDCPKKQIKMFMLKVCSAIGSSKCERKLNKHSPDHGHGDGHGPHPGPPRLPKKKVADIKKVLEDIRAGNKKRQAFEGGFISEKGIKEREWYKHKVTAPGLWLGYGATTFPAITEALTIDNSIELAQKEADELAEMIDAMTKRLRA